MRLSTKGCYGLRAMVELGSSYGGGPVLMRTIAEKHGISRKYLHALLTTLRSAGLVRSVRGAGGGYVLARSPSLIRLSEVVQTLEGPLTLAECVQNEGACARAARCVGRDLWLEMSLALERVLGSITLADLVARASEKETRTPMYDI